MLRRTVLHIGLAFKELVANPLRTFLSLLGVAIGVFCIVAVKTVFESLENNIQTSMSKLGDDVLYVGKFAWMPEGDEEYAYWKYKARPTCNLEELDFIQDQVQSASYSALMHSEQNISIQYENIKVDQSSIYAVTFDFNKLQDIDIDQGRFFSLQEMKSSQSSSIVLGKELADELFGPINPIDKYVRLYGRKWRVIGVMRRQGQNLTGFNFDPAAIIAFSYYSTFKKLDKNTQEGFANPNLMVKTAKGKKFENMKFEVKGALRSIRKLRPKDADNFSMNQLDGVQRQVAQIFSRANIIGLIVGFFSLIVGVFSVANIMFVSVRERTAQIGLKKALGAKNTVVLSEFLIESIVLCLLGGLLGLGLVYLSAALITGVFDFPIELKWNNVLYGLLISIMVGLIAGYIPARRAARLNPVEAIRS